MTDGRTKPLIELRVRNLKNDRVEIEGEGGREKKKAKYSLEQDDNIEKKSDLNVEKFLRQEKSHKKEFQLTDY